MDTKAFTDENGATWVADAEEEQTPRHHGRWFLVFRAAGGSGREDRFAMPEVRWQTHATAQRTLRSMSEFELRRRLNIVRERALLTAGASPAEGAPPEALRQRTNASAG